jgi:hypothetical protein
MAVTFDASASDNGSKGLFDGSTLSTQFTHVSGAGTDRMAIVLGKYHDSSSTASGSITIGASFGVQPMTALGSVMFNNGTGDKATLFYLANPPTGNQTVLVTATAPQVNRGIIGISMTFAGVKGLGPLASSAGTGSVNATITYGGFANGLVVTAMGWASPGMFSGPGSVGVAYKAQAEGTRDSHMVADTANGPYTQTGTAQDATPWGILGVSLVGDSPFFAMM